MEPRSPLHRSVLGVSVAVISVAAPIVNGIGPAVQPSSSVTETSYDPGVIPVSVSVISPRSEVHEYVKGAVPFVGVATAVPSLSPKHDSSVVATVIVISAFSPIVKNVGPTVQPLPSSTVT